MEKSTKENDVPNIQSNNRLPNKIRKNNSRQKQETHLDTQSKTSKKNTGVKSQAKINYVAFVDRKVEEREQIIYFFIYSIISIDCIFTRKKSENKEKRNI